MNVGLVPVWNPPQPQLVFASSGAALAAAAELLDACADEAGLTPLTQFVDMREVPEDFEGDADELAAVLGDWDEWFDAEWGAEATAALLNAMQQPTARKLGWSQFDAVQRELQELARVLSLAAQTEAEFRLEITCVDTAAETAPR